MKICVHALDEKDILFKLQTSMQVPIFKNKR